MKKLIAAGLAVAMLLPASVAFADMNSSSLTIVATNQGSIDNTTRASARTGGNFAGGSFGGDGDEGGTAVKTGAGNGDATAGNGGTGGNGGPGGLVETGDATSDSASLNSLNSSDFDIDLGGGDMNSSSADVTVDNDDVDNVITNDTRARARTGDNFAGGSFGGDGDDGGDATKEGAGNGNANGGHGGHGGTGGIGGEVVTGTSVGNAGAINVLNTTIMRVRI